MVVWLLLGALIREGPLRVEGKLLEGRAGQRVKVWAGGGRQIDRRPAPGCGSRIGGQAAPGVSGCQSAEWRRGGETSRATDRFRQRMISFLDRPSAAGRPTEGRGGGGGRSPGVT